MTPQYLKTSMLPTLLKLPMGKVNADLAGIWTSSTQPNARHTSCFPENTERMTLSLWRFQTQTLVSSLWKKGQRSQKALQHYLSNMILQTVCSCHPDTGTVTGAVATLPGTKTLGNAGRLMAGHAQQLSQKITKGHAPPLFLLSPQPGLPDSGVCPPGRQFHQVGICVTREDFKMLYLETWMCNVSLEIYTFSVKDTSAVQDRHV